METCCCCGQNIINKPNRVSFYWMNDNHTFVKVFGDTLDEIFTEMEATHEKYHGGGMACPPIFMVDDKEVRRLPVYAHCHCSADSDHSDWNTQFADYKEAVEADPDIKRLFSKKSLLQKLRGAL